MGVVNQFLVQYKIHTMKGSPPLTMLGDWTAKRPRIELKMTGKKTGDEVPGLAPT